MSTETTETVDTATMTQEFFEGSLIIARPKLLAGIFPTDKLQIWGDEQGAFYFKNEEDAKAYAVEHLDDGDYKEKGWEAIVEDKGLSFYPGSEAANVEFVPSVKGGDCGC